MTVNCRMLALTPALSALLTARIRGTAAGSQRAISPHISVGRSGAGLACDRSRKLARRSRNEAFAGALAGCAGRGGVSACVVVEGEGACLCSTAGDGSQPIGNGNPIARPDCKSGSLVLQP
ncbi:hypothetical protein, partial [Ralstonia solanacearum]|uniref:hypothetical protein n=1 Tax=Ralstonia solanacearum TaxID=305 RepID=UPI001E48F7EC